MMLTHTFVCATFLLSTVIGGDLGQRDPLASWNEGPNKEAIDRFVERVTDRQGPDFVPEAERIAVFDNDGTLWPENPIPFQLAFARDRLGQLVADQPQLQSDPMVAAALEGDLPELLKDQAQGLRSILARTHAEVSTEEFASQVDRWIRTAKHPRFERPYGQCLYQPMLELLAYLRAHGFKTYIVSGGGADFMRVWSERAYGIPPEQVIGSYGSVRYQLREGQPVLIKTFDQVFIDDKEGKPVAIHRFLGRRPIMAFGNSDGDQAMIQYTTIANPRPSLGLILHHTDADREYAYDAHPKSSGKLVQALAEAPERGWLVVDMKKDWSQVLIDRQND